MARSQERVADRHWSRRAFLVASIKGALGLTLVGRLFDLQFINREYYSILSDHNRIQTWCELPPRGRFLDTNDVILADNQVMYRCFLNPEGDMNHVLHMRDFLSLTQDFVQELNQKWGTRKRRHPVLIKHQLTWKELVHLEMHIDRFPGVNIMPCFVRRYPYDDLLAHIVGYVGCPNKRERHQILQMFPAMGGERDTGPFHVGKAGFEKVYQPTLMGDHGLQYVEVDACGRKVRTLHHVSSRPGQDVALTIDVRIQKITQCVLQEARIQEGCAIVMEAATGAIRSCVSLPSFNPNNFLKGLSQEEWKSLYHQKSLSNKALQGAYAPGSTFKMMVILAALHSGVINEHTCFHCPGYVDVDGHIFHCHSWRYRGHGTMNPVQALSYSCDVYFYQIARTLSFDILYQVARDFGFGVVTGVELLHERTGQVPHPTAYALKQKKWNMGDALNVSIGQGALLSTPMQMVRMMAILNNGLRAVSPHFVRDTLKRSSPVHLHQYQPQHVELIQKGMHDAVHKPWGTCRRAALPGMVGKSGSTQVCHVTADQRANAAFWGSRPRHLREHAMFVGYKAPYAVVVLAEHSGSGGKVAAPVAARILKRV